MKMFRIVSAAIIGNILEVYDMTVYGFFASTMAEAFFPKEDKLAGIASVFGVFLIGYLARPIGSILFGYIGDQIGRKTALIVSILLMAFGTFLLGLLPTYQMVGVWAPLLLLMMRLFQGLSFGGEFTGSIIFIVEHAPPQKKGFYGSFGMVGVSLGLLLASLVAWLIHFTFTHAQIITWAWRIPFLIAIFGGVIGWLIRRGVREPALFRQAQQMPQSRLNFKRELAKQFRQGAIILGITLFGVALTYLIYIFVITYMTSVLHYTMRQTLTVNISSVILLILLEPLVGKLSDKIGRRMIMAFAIIGSAIWIWPYFFLLQQHNIIVVLIAQFVMTIFAAAYFAIATVAMVEIVPVKVRFSVVSFAYALGASLFGGGTPFIATMLIKFTHSYASLAIYLVICAFISLIAVHKIRETKHS